MINKIASALSICIIALVSVLLDIHALEINFDLYKVETIKDFKGEPLAIAKHPSNEKTFRYATREENTVIIWDVDRRVPLQKVSFDNTILITTAEWYADDAKYLAAVLINDEEAEALISDANMHVRKTVILDVDTGISIRTFSDDMKKDEQNIKKEKNGGAGSSKIVAFSQGGEMLATAAFSNSIVVWDIKSGRRQYYLGGHEDRVASLDFGEKLLASASRDKTIRLWNYESGRLVKTLEGHRELVYSVAWNPLEKHLLASGSWDKTVRLWDIENDKQIILKHDEKVSEIAWNPDGKILAAGQENGGLRLWDTENGSYRTLGGHSKSVVSLVWIDHGKKLISVCLDGIVKIWTFMAKKEYEEYQKKLELEVDFIQLDCN